MSTIFPAIGYIVHYTLSEADAEQINRRRDDTEAQRLRVSRGLAPATTGSQKHIGNRAEAGQVYPMLIVRTWGSTPESAVNGQVFLDGNDSLWVTSVTQGEGERRWVVAVASAMSEGKTEPSKVGLIKARLVLDTTEFDAALARVQGDLEALPLAASLQVRIES